MLIQLTAIEDRHCLLHDGIEAKKVLPERATVGASNCLRHVQSVCLASDSNRSTRASSRSVCGRSASAFDVEAQPCANCQPRFSGILCRTFLPARQGRQTARTRLRMLRESPSPTWPAQNSGGYNENLPSRRHFFGAPIRAPSYSFLTLSAADTIAPSAELCVLAFSLL